MFYNPFVTFGFYYTPLTYNYFLSSWLMWAERQKEFLEKAQVEPYKSNIYPLVMERWLLEAYCLNPIYAHIYHAMKKVPWG